MKSAITEEQVCPFLKLMFSLFKEAIAYFTCFYVDEEKTKKKEAGYEQGFLGSFKNFIF